MSLHLYPQRIYWDGRAADNVTIRPWFQAPATYDPTFYQAMQYVLQTSADAANVQLRNNTMVGYADTCVRKGVISPSSSGNSTPEGALPVATNSCWTEFDDFEEYQQAKRVGQIRT